MKAIIVCVEYSDFLALTLPRNFRHFERVLVVTSPGDHDTITVASMCGAEVFITESFWRDDAEFNKFRALEEGLDALGRDGWLCVMDADVIWPTAISGNFQIGNLYTPHRRMMTDMRKPIPEESAWRQFPRHACPSSHFSGYSHIFHATDPALGPTPWHETNWRHAGGADTIFQNKWPSERKVRPSWECLHLGEAGINWCGRSSKFLDGTEPDNKEERLGSLESFMRQRRKTGRFDHERIARAIHDGTV